MLSNLKAEMVRAGVSVDDVATKVGKSCRTIRDRLNGKVMFPINEAIAVRNAFFPGMDLDYLFSRSERESA